MAARRGHLARTPFRARARTRDRLAVRTARGTARARVETGGSRVPQQPVRLEVARFGQIRPQLCAHLAEYLAVNHGDHLQDGFGQVAKVLPVLDGRRRVPVALDDHALGLVVVEVGVELERSAVLGPYDLHGLSGQALVLLDLALVKLETSDTQDLTHVSGLPSALLIDASVHRRAPFRRWYWLTRDRPASRGVPTSRIEGIGFDDGGGIDGVRRGRSP